MTNEWCGIIRFSYTYNSLKALIRGNWSMNLINKVAKSNDKFPYFHKTIVRFRDLA